MFSPFATCESECSLCLEKYATDDACIILPSCKHKFHTTCLFNSYFKSSNKCPLCRKVIYEKPNITASLSYREIIVERDEPQQIIESTTTNYMYNVIIKLLSVHGRITFSNYNYNYPRQILPYMTAIKRFMFVIGHFIFTFGFNPYLLYVLSVKIEKVNSYYLLFGWRCYYVWAYYLCILHIPYLHQATYVKIVSDILKILIGIFIVWSIYEIM